jgi:mono/diheme cytochrome c family protein
MRITYICAVISKKWYIEFFVILIMIAGAIVFALNINFSSQDAVFHVSKPKDGLTPKSSPEKERWLVGRDLFKANCASCHNPKSDGVGPPLIGVTARWKAAGNYQGKTGEQWMRVWIKNWRDVVNAGYKYGIDMHNSRPAEMNIFGGYLTDEKIDNILFYVENPDLGKTPAVAAN